MNKIPTGHEVKIKRQPELANVELHIGGRKVAETTLHKDVTRDSDSVQRFVRQYFHIAGPKE